MNSLLNVTVPALIGAGTGVFAIWKGLGEYRKSREQKEEEIKMKNRELAQKRQEKLFPLIKEFDESESIRFAKMILDGLAVSPDRSIFGIPDFRVDPDKVLPFLMTKPNTDWIKIAGTPIVKDNRVELREGHHSLALEYHPNFPIQVVTIDDKEYTFIATPAGSMSMNLVWCYDRSTLIQILRDDFRDPVLDEGENKIRQSFDALLDFFGKLGYLISVGLIKENEILYFDYYLNEITALPGDVPINRNPVLLYSITYGFKLFGLLVKELKLLPEKQLEELTKRLNLHDIQRTSSTA